MVKPGDVVRVKVLDVDVARKRISLTLRLTAGPGRRGGAVGGIAVIRGRSTASCTGRAWGRGRRAGR